MIISFIVLATAITIVNYDRKTFIVQDTDLREYKIECSVASMDSFWEAKTINIKINLKL